MEDMDWGELTNDLNVVRNEHESRYTEIINSLVNMPTQQTIELSQNTAEVPGIYEKSEVN